MNTRPYAHTHTQTHKYLLSIVRVTRLNSWLLTGAWGWLCASSVQTSAALPPGQMAVLSSLIQKGEPPVQ